jgi:hypothetical protein
MADGCFSTLWGMYQPTSSLILEDCTLEAAFDSPALDRLVACAGREGAHVGLLNPVPNTVMQYTALDLLLRSIAFSAGDDAQLRGHGLQACGVRRSKAHFTMKDCLVDFSTKEPYRGAMPLVSAVTMVAAQCGRPHHILSEIWAAHSSIHTVSHNLDAGKSQVYRGKHIPPAHRNPPPCTILTNACRCDLE